jgi:uncharacterized protein YlxW (UPF0749 family)
MNSTQIVITALLAVLGFAATAAIQGASGSKVLDNARQSDLVSVLDDLAQREARLQVEIGKLETERETLLGGDQYQALTDAKRRAKALGILAGTEPVVGAGIDITISGSLSATTLLDAVQELRDAGATAMQVSDRNLSVRIVAGTWFADSDNGVTASGTALSVPIVLSVVGDSTVLTPALQIPGGLVDTVGAGGGSVVIKDNAAVEVSSVVALPSS